MLLSKVAKFFVPTAWEKNSDSINFPTKTEPQSGDGDVNNPVKSKKKRGRRKKKTVEEEQNAANPAGAGVLAPPPTANAEEETDAKPVGKIKSGRVEKKALQVLKKGKAKQQKPEKQLPLMIAQAKAARQETILAKAAAAKAEIQQESKGDADCMETTSGEENNADDDEEEEEVLVEAAPDSGGATSAFETQLKSSLLGGRFRFINEQLYTMDSKKAETLFRTDMDAFIAYHAGYKQQVEKWPLNPLDRIIKMIRRLPKTLLIGDFGCGEGKLAKSVPNKVYSMDLVSSRADIIACNMDKTPLGAESLDIAVYCLSLMGTNLKDYLLEANRVLKMDGLVFIAEIQSRFDNVPQFLRGVNACGFECIKRDLNVKLFYFFQFKKIRNVGKVALVPPFSLKPCLYRKR